MRFNIQKALAKIDNEHKRKAKWYKVVGALAAIVVFCTVYALILPAITLESDKAAENGVFTEGAAVENTAIEAGDAAVDETVPAEDAASEEAAAEEEVSEEASAEQTEEAAVQTEEAAAEEQAAEAKDGDKEKTDASAEKEDEKTEEAAPRAMTFTESTFDNDVTVKVEAEAGAFPEGTTMKIKPVAKRNVIDAIDAAVTAKVESVKAVDITFYNKEGKEIEPAEGKTVKVTITGRAIADAKDPVVIHIKEDNGVQKGEVVKGIDTNDQSVGDISFRTNDFSIYAIVGTETIEDTVLTADGKTYKITVTYGPEAGIPDGSKLKVKEILPGTAKYESYNEQAIDKLDADAAEKEKSDAAAVESEDEGTYEAQIVSLPDETEVGSARYFDISIISDGKEVEPAAAVEVKIEYAEPVELSSGEKLQIVHFADDGIEVIEPKIRNNEIIFEQESFSVTATVTTNTSNNGQYALLVQYDGKYYEVLFDGTLEEVTPSGNNSYTVSTAERWTWNRQGNSGSNYRIRVQTNTGYEYIDPAASDGISTTARTITRTASGNGYYLSGGGNYLGVTTDAEGNPVLTGNISAQSNAAVFYFATLASSVSGNTVDHIDIGVQGSAVVSVPLAYGTYYYADGSEAMTVQVGQHVNAKGVNNAVPVTEADLMSATISAYTKDGSGNRTYDNSFIIDEYTSSTGSGQAMDQVRIGGTFPVGSVVLSQAGSRGNVEQYITTDNQIYYEVDVTKPVELTLQDSEGNTLYQKDGSGNLVPLTVTVNVTLTSNFSYWDDDNECPGISSFGRDRRTGAGTVGGVSGMDFVLGTSDDTDADLAAIEIIKYTVNTDGQLISVDSGGTFNFDIYQNVEGDVTAPTAWSGETTETVDYSGYTKVSSRSITAGEAGYGVSYDYSVDRGLVYIEETGDLEGTSITDTDGNTWDYVETYIETEYVWRDDDGVAHSNKKQDNTMRAIPDVVGDYYSTTHEGELHNTFLEFYVYNVYKGGEVEFKKVDQSGNLLPGATFGLFLSDPSEGTGSIEDISGSGAIKAYEATSEENSEGNVEVDFESVAYGTYYMYEIAAPDGYVKDNGVYKVEVYEADGNEYCKVYKWNPETEAYDIELDKKNDLYVFPNYPESLDVSILKTTEDGETALPGAAFSLYGDDYYAEDGTTVNPDAEVISSVTTGSDGKVSLGSLPSGTYYLVETSAPSGLGYKVLPEPVKIIVDAAVATDAVTYESSAVKDVQKVTETVDVDGTMTQVTYYLITIKDDPETTEIPVEKIWNDNDNAYNMRPESISVQLKVGDEVKDTQALNADNEWKYTWENLPAYTYTIEDGVLTDAAAIEYNVVESGDVTGYTSETSGDADSGFEITNTINDYEVGIQKIGDGNEDNKLNGATFDLYTDEDHTVKAKDASGKEIASFTTAGEGDNKGKATVGNLLPGKYYLAETDAPDGYKLLTEDVVITIDSRGVTYGSSSTPATVIDGIYTIIVSDTSGAELPMTGGPGTLIYTLGGMLLMASAALMYGFRNKRAERRSK